MDAALSTAKADRRIHTISVGPGEHQVKWTQANFVDVDFYLSIDFPITIVGNGDKNEVVVVVGFRISKGVQGNVHIQNMTIRNLEGVGFFGYSPFFLEDVLVEQCKYHGVAASLRHSKRVNS